MKQLHRVFRLFSGLFLFAIAITLTIQANLGLAPWDVFHSGLSQTLGISFGQASIMVGFVILLINYYLGERIGWGSVCNMFFIGLFIDGIMKSGMIPRSHHFASGFLMLNLGLLLVGFASYFYISSGLGTGPRDGFMVALLKRTHKSVALTRNSMEAFALVCGLLLGGKLGVGTVYVVLTVGYFLQFAYRICRFDVKSVQHRYIDEDLRKLLRLVKKSA